MPAESSSASACGVNARSAARSILRRWPNAAATTRSSTAGSAGASGAARGTSRATLEVTLGGGTNAAAGTSKARSARQRHCAAIASRPQARVPGEAVRRSTTSFCSMMVRDSKASGRASHASSSGVPML